MFQRFALFLVFTSTLTGQHSEGPFIGCPLLLTVGPNTLGPTGSTPLARSSLYLKPAGFVDLAASMATAGLPEFTMSAMFLSAPTPPPNFRIDAFSSGYHRVFATHSSSGYFLLDFGSTGGWGAIVFSVTSDSLGSSEAVAVQTEAARPDGPGADLFSLVLPGSTLPSSLGCVPVGVAQRATDSEQMGFQTGTVPPVGRPEMTDCDPFFTLYETGATHLPLQPSPWAYFSLPSPLTSHPYVSSWFQRRNGGPIPSAAHGATILRTQWVSTAPTPHWSPPEVFLTSVELGLTNGDDDIDALAVDEANGLVLLSVRRTASRALTGEQLMVASFTLAGGTVTAGHPAQPYVYDTPSDGLAPLAQLTGVTSGAGGSGDVDATCEFDPNNGLLNPLVMCFVRDCRSDLPFPTTMASSVFRTVSGTSTASAYAVSVDGLPLTDTSALAGLIVGFPQPNGGILLGGVTVFLLLPVPSSEFTWIYSVPYTAQGTLWGASLDFQWAAVGSGGVTLAPVVRIRV